MRERLACGAPSAFNRLASWGLWEPLGGDYIPRQMKVYKRKLLGDIERSWELTEDILNALNRSVLAHDARFAVVYVPSRFEVSDRDWDLTRLRFSMNERWDRDLVRQRLRRLSDSGGYPLLDLTPALRTAEESWFGEPYFRVDGHWNETGHGVAAEAVSEFLAKSRWLDGAS